MIRLIDERVMEKLRDRPENIDLEEFLPLVGEWREDKASKAKCPYCVKPIEKQATKCNHCLSEIEWFKFDGLYGPCKAGASDEMNRALFTAKTTFHALVEGNRAAEEAEIKATEEADEELRQELVERLARTQCEDCNCRVFNSSQLRPLSTLEKAIKFRDFQANPIGSGIFFCYECQRRKDRKFLMSGAGILTAIFLFVWWAISTAK
ncbi:hypothetical protein OAE85_01720 [Akkermansiaceae bacterium]|nr:hypothetical protein [Akkermansiaceae bacterium]